jgi:sec-independent protein translocase protein TatC
VFNLMLFAVPMVLLYFVGVFASYLLVLKREGKGFPWKVLFGILGALLVVGGGVVYLLIARYGFKLIHTWPFLTR